MKVTYDQSIEGEVGDIIKKRIKVVSHLFPDWCSEVVIFYDPTGDGTHTLTCTPNYAYRWVQLMVNPPFLNDHTWKHSLIHEIHHAILSPYVSKVEALLEHFIRDETLKNYLGEEFIAAEEAVAQDLAGLTEKLVDGK